jgi:hypothetical protein
MNTSRQGVRLEKLIVVVREIFSALYGTSVFITPQCVIKNVFFYKLYETYVFHRGVDEIFVLLGYYAAQLSSWLPTFRDKVLAPFSTVTQASIGLLAPCRWCRYVVWKGR